MSDSAGPQNTANISISTDYETFKTFLREAFDGFDALKKKGREVNEDVSKSAQKFLNNAWLGTAAGVAKELGSVMLAPIRTSMTEATKLAREFRAENTRLAVSLGRDFRDVGDELDRVAIASRRPQESIRSYGESVREVTGDWKRAADSYEDYSKLASYLGKKNVEEMAGLAVEMDQVFGVGGKNKAGDFFNQLIAQAERLGVNGQQAVRIWNQVGSTVGREGQKGEAGGVQAKRDAALIPAMQKYGLTGDEIGGALGRASGLFSGDLQWMERHFRAQGQLGKNESLRDKRTGRLNFALPDLLEKLYNTEMRRSGGNKDRLYQRLTQDQNLGPQLGALISNFPELKGHLDSALATPAPAPGQGALDKADAKRRATPEEQRNAEEARKKLEDRKMGELLLRAQDELAKGAKGGMGGVVTDAVAGGIGAAGVGAIAKRLLGLGLKGPSPAGMLASVAMMSGDGGRAATGEERAAWLKEHGQSFLTREVAAARAAGPDHYRKEAQRLRDVLAQTQEQRGQGGISGWLARHNGVNAEQTQASIAFNEQMAADLQAKATADKLGQTILRVVVMGQSVMPDPPSGGVQNGSR